MILTAAYWIYALLLACLAVCWADVLVRPGMLLAPLQSWLRARYRRPTRPRAMLKNPGWPEYWPEYVQGYGAEVSKEIDDQWWWPPIWGCFKCVAGQLAFWGYLLLFPLPAYSLLAHLGFTAVTILLSIIVQKWSQ